MREGFFENMSLFVILSLLLLTCQSNAQYPTNVIDPGSIQLYFDVDSINNIAQTMIPIMSYYMLNNVTYNINF